MTDYLLSVNQSMSSSSYLGIAVTLGIIGVLGFFMNFLVIFTIISDSQTLWNPVNVILLNLAVGDLFVAALGNPIALVSAINEGWYWSHQTCIWYAWLMSTLGLASIGNLAVMAVERWLLVSRPTQRFSIRSAMFMAGCVWIYALSLSMPPLFGWGSYGPEAGNVSCSVSWEAQDSEYMSRSYITFLLTFGLVLPVILICSSYYAIIFSIKQVKKRIRGSRGRREAKVTKMVALMIVAFLIAWTPYAAMAVAAQYFDAKPESSIAVLPSLLAKSSICYNPVIYAGLNAQFPRSLKKLLGIRETNDERAGYSQTTEMSGLHRIRVTQSP